MPIHPGLLEEIPEIKLKSDLKGGFEDQESSKEVIKDNEPDAQDIMSNLAKWVSIVCKGANLAQNTVVSDEKIVGVKNIHNYGVVVKITT